MSYRLGLVAAAFATVLAAGAIEAAADHGGGRGGGGEGGGRGGGRGGEGGGGGPLPVLGVTLLGQALGAGGLYAAWRRRRAQRQAREQAGMLANRGLD